MKMEDELNRFQKEEIEKGKAQKRAFLLPGIILALLHEWTASYCDPLENLAKLNISPDSAEKTIRRFIADGYVKETIISSRGPLSTLEILTHPQDFRETYILTDKGERFYKNIEIAKLIEWWRKYQ